MQYIPPLEAVLDWVRVLSRFLPLTYLLDGMRWSLTGAARFGNALISCGVTASLGATLFWLSTQLMHWALGASRISGPTRAPPAPG